MSLRPHTNVSAHHRYLVVDLRYVQNIVIFQLTIQKSLWKTYCAIVDRIDLAAVAVAAAVGRGMVVVAYYIHHRNCYPDHLNVPKGQE